MVVTPLDTKFEIVPIDARPLDGVLRVRMRREREKTGWLTRRIIHSLYLSVELSSTSELALRSSRVPDDEVLVRGPRGRQELTKGDLLEAGLRGVEKKFTVESLRQRLDLENAIETALGQLAERVPELRSVAVLRRIAGA